MFWDLTQQMKAGPKIIQAKTTQLFVDAMAPLQQTNSSTRYASLKVSEARTMRLRPHSPTVEPPEMRIFPIWKLQLIQPKHRKQKTIKQWIIQVRLSYNKLLFYFSSKNNSNIPCKWFQKPDLQLGPRARPVPMIQQVLVSCTWDPFTKPRFISIFVPPYISEKEIYPNCFSRLLLLVIQIISNCATHWLLRLTSLFSQGARADPVPTPQQLLRLRLSNPHLSESFPMSWILGRTHRPTKWYAWVYVIAYSCMLLCFMET